MANLSETLSKFKFDGEFFWEARLHLRWWDDEVLIRVDAEGGLSHHQKKVIGEIVSQTESIRPEAGSRLFTHYRSFLADQLPGERSGFPAVEEMNDIWAILSTPVLVVPEEAGPKIRFALEFTWSWENEHGISVSISDWQIERLAARGEII